MPFVERFSLSVAAFFGCSHAGFAWTDRRALDALDALAALYEPLSVCRAFADALSSFPHAGGTAFDLCRGRLHASARRFGALRWPPAGFGWRTRTFARPIACMSRR